MSIMRSKLCFKINISLSSVSKCGIVVCNWGKHLKRLNSKTDKFDTDSTDTIPNKTIKNVCDIWSLTWAGAATLQTILTIDRPHPSSTLLWSHLGCYCLSVTMAAEICWLVPRLIKYCPRMSGQSKESPLSILLVTVLQNNIELK